MCIKRVFLKIAAACCLVSMIGATPLLNNAENGVFGYMNESSSDAAGGSANETMSDAILEAAAESPSVALKKAVITDGLGDIWKNFGSDFSFLSGSRGDGSKEKPFQISTAAQLKGLAELAARGMTLDGEEGRPEGDYGGMYFELGRDIDLSGIKWVPIGFYTNDLEMTAENARPFCGHFDGRGRRITNLSISEETFKDAGLFGIVVDSEIHDLEVSTAARVKAAENAGILVARAENSDIRNVTVSGKAGEAKYSGGIAGTAKDSCIENCSASSVAVDSGTVNGKYAGGIAGRIVNSVVADCSVVTGTSAVTCLQGTGYIGGVTGLQDHSDIFNVSVSGRIGGAGSLAVGGITGEYFYGKIKVVRFSGNIASTGKGSESCEGMVIGTHGDIFFEYGTGKNNNIAYIFTDSIDKIRGGICGCGPKENSDNEFTYDAHIGVWRGADNYFTLVQTKNPAGTKTDPGKYFYEELEDGILNIIGSGEDAAGRRFSPDHFAPTPRGEPGRGYLVSVLQINSITQAGNYYDVAVLTARGSSIYSKTIDKSNRGAVAAGSVITVETAPKNTASEKYQMNGVPTYTDRNDNRIEMNYVTGGTYTFVMPEHDTEISADYRKVAASVRTDPEEVTFTVTQERLGDRRNPSTVTEVRDGKGKLIARYLDGKPDSGTKVTDVYVNAVVDTENDVFDERVAWSVDDPDLLILKRNDDEDVNGYTGKSASIELNLEARFFTDIIKELEKEQAKYNYRNPIPDTVFGNGDRGGVAVLSASTRPAASFGGKPVSANCKISVTFQILDRTELKKTPVSGGNSHGSGGGGKVTADTAAIPEGENAAAGVWAVNEEGKWTFSAVGMDTAGKWLFIAGPDYGADKSDAAWFRFDDSGYMMTGWFLDPADNAWYYLTETKDANEGKMVTGWNFINGYWYYFAGFGRMMSGWQWIDGKRYCLDEKDGFMYSDTVTPDGMTVDASGAWIVNGIIQTM